MILLLLLLQLYPTGIAVKWQTPWGVEARIVMGYNSRTEIYIVKTPRDIVESPKITFEAAERMN